MNNFNVNYNTWNGLRYEQSERRFHETQRYRKFRALANSTTNPEEKAEIWGYYYDALKRAERRENISSFLWDCFSIVVLFVVLYVIFTFIANDPNLLSYVQ